MGLKLYALTKEQEGFWLDYCIYPKSYFYNASFFVKVKGDLDVERFIKSDNIVKNHFYSIGRTRIKVEAGVPYIYLEETAGTQHFEYIDLTQKNEYNSSPESILTDKNRVPFKLESESSTRSVLIKYADDVYYYSFIQHHILSDAVTADLYCQGLSLVYNNNEQELKEKFPQRDLQDCVDFLDVESSDIDFWRQKLEDVDVKLDFGSPKFSSIREGRGVFKFLFEEKYVDALKSSAKNLRTTPYLFMRSVFGILLYKYWGRNDIIFNYGFNARKGDFHYTTGNFVKTIPYKFSISDDMSISELIANVNNERKKDRRNRKVSSLDIINIYNSNERNKGQKANVSFAQSKFSYDSFILNDCEVETLNIHGIDSGDDLNFVYDPFINDFKAAVFYNAGLFDEAFISRMVNYYKYLLLTIADNLEVQIKDLSSVTDLQSDLLLKDFNNTSTNFPKEKCIHQIFEERAEETPENVALVFEDTQISYRELNERSNQLAHYLLEKGVKPDTLIGLCVDRSIEMIVGLLGILKAGGAYVPMDPTYPQERISFMLKDADCKIVLTQEGLQLPQTASEKICLDTDWAKIETNPTHNAKSEVKSNNLAYVIYTSGSTGKPKGVMLSHSGITNLQQEQGRIFNITEADIILQFASLSFDASVWEIFMGLSKSAKLVLCKSDKLIDVRKLAQLIDDNQVSIVTLPPTILNLLDSNLPSLQKVISAGENCTVDLVKKWAVNCTFFNAYGPTEATVCASIYECNIDDLGPISIGKAIGNTQAYILDEKMNLAPIGVSGELCVAGEGLARGYLNRPELTAQKFIANPFSTSSNSRLYKTGDMARYLPDGNIEFIGRKDDQIKIRGFRIELGEIQSALNLQDEVASNAVLIKEDNLGNKQLVAYVVPAAHILDKGGMNMQQLRDSLSKTLPHYMVPSLFVSLDIMPLTSNGKIDKKALPDPEIKSGDDYLAPSNDLENSIVEIWAQVLGINKSVISINKSFFEIGGNSLLSFRLQQRLSELDAFKNIQVSDLFKYHTINKLVESIQSDISTEYKLQGKAQVDNHEIAIIGMSGAFSDVRDITEFWELIKNQNEGVRSYSKEECEQLGSDISLFEDPDYVPVSGLVKDIDKFDPSFWDISPNEAKLTDPQIRKFIEHCWFTLESAGYIHLRSDYNIGVFGGSGTSSYLHFNILNGELASDIDIWEALTANSKDALATKAAYMLGLSGPAYAINTACSTGLVSIVEACNYLQLGKCEMALAGGVSLAGPNHIGYTYQEGMISSKDGHCRTFDEDASGTIGGSGVGVVLLKRLEDAVNDNDNIIAVIKGYASNNDGDRKTDYTAPSVTGQAECIINAQKMADISSSEVDYVECHGTATNLGDPIEVQALKEAFAFNDIKDRPKHKTVLGAVKANIGHADAAAGTAGLIKTCLMMQNNIIPGQPNFNTPNPRLNIEQTRFEISKENKEWLPSLDHQRIAGVSSFGIGGTNAHVIIGDYINKNIEQKSSVTSKNGQSESVIYIVPISAKSKASLEKYKEQLIKYIGEADQDLSIVDIAYTLQEKRDHFSYRSAYCAKDAKELVDKLKQHQPTHKLYTEQSNKIVFMFPGQGAQYPGMAKDLYDNDGYFKSTIDKLISIANTHLEVDLYDVIFQEGDAGRYDLKDTQWAQISLFIIEYALADYIEHLGIHSDAYIGHSIGEYVAATLSGVFSVADAIKIVIARGKLMQSMESGSMLAISAQENEIDAIVKTHNCEIAVINSSEDIVVSGRDADISALKLALDSRSILAIILNTSHAYHSKMMDQAASEFESIFDTIQLNRPAKLFASNLSGEIAQEEVSRATYWSKQLRNTVLFAKGIHSLTEKINNKISFIEVGPGKGLCSFVTKYKNDHSDKAIQSISILPSRKENIKSNIKQVSKEDILAKFWTLGIIEQPNDLKLLEQAKRLTDLPTYQFNYKSYWLEANLNNIENNQLKIQPKERWLYRPAWIPISNLNRSNQGEVAYNNALVFIRKDQLGSFDFSFLAAEIHFVVLASEGQQEGINRNANTWYVNAESEYDFQRLAKHLKDNKTDYDLIIHASSINNVSQIDEALSNSFYSLFLIHQYLLNANNLKKLLVLTNGLTQITYEDVINPANGALIGAIRNINHEYPNLDARAIDVGYEVSGGGPDIHQVTIDKAYHKSDELLAIRFGQLWKESIERIDGSVPKVNQIQEGDHILITGGLGGVALSIADYISRKHNVKFTFVSRNDIYKDPNPTDSIKSKIDIVEGIRANGSTVDIQAFDISDVQQVIALKDKIEIKYKGVDGIIHTAGVQPLAIDQFNLENVKIAFKGKVYGIHNIINTFNLDNSKYLVSSSSLASIMGDVNRIEYCASNSYLDYLSANKVGFKNMKIRSINFPGWSDVGMAKTNNSKIGGLGKLQGLPKLLSLNAVNQNEGAEIFYQLINQSNYDQIILSKLNIQSLKNRLFNNQSNANQVVPVNIKEENYSETEFKMAQIWSQVLGVEEMGIHDNFFDLGGNSLLATRVISKIRTEFNNELPLKMMFENSTLHTLSKQIDTGKLDDEKLSKIQKFNSSDKKSEVDFEEVEF